MEQSLMTWEEKLECYLAVQIIYVSAWVTQQFVSDENLITATRRSDWMSQIKFNVEAASSFRNEAMPETAIVQLNKLRPDRCLQPKVSGRNI